MSDFFTATAEFMVKDSDWTLEDAKSTLYRNVDTLRNTGAPFIVFADYILVMLTDEDVEDFYFTKKVSSFAVFPEEQEVYSYSHMEGVNLPFIDHDFEP